MNKLIEQMADEFCRWPLPESVPKTLYLKSTGESIFTHAEAIAMFTEIVGPKILALEAENERLRDAQLGNSAYLTADADRRASEARLAVVERETIERCLLALRTKHAEIQHLWSEHGRDDRDESYGIHTAISIVQALANQPAGGQTQAYSIPAFLRQFPDQTAAAQALRNTTAETGNSQPPTLAPAVAHSKSQK